MSYEILEYYRMCGVIPSHDFIMAVFKPPQARNGTFPPCTVRAVILFGCAFCNVGFRRCEYMYAPPFGLEDAFVEM